MLRVMFILGAVIDGAIAISWFLIASGMSMPNILNGYTGAGPDYRLAMYVSAMFMTGWTVLLVWGAIKPVERRDLLLIISAMLLLSVGIELVFYGEMMAGGGFVLGGTKRVVLSILAATAYISSFYGQESIETA